MRIGVICTDEKMLHNGFKITKTAENGGVEIYKASVFYSGKKRRFARVIRRCVKVLSEIGVSVCVAEEWVSNIYPGGMTFISRGERVIRSKAGEAALAFASENGIFADVLIRGGTFSETVEAAKQILKSRRNVFVQNPAFDDIAEAVCCETGVSICGYIPGKYLEINLGGEGHFLEFGEKIADFSDLSVSIPEKMSAQIPEKLVPPLAETLEISGFLRRKEIKVGYFPDKKTKN